MPTTTPRPSNPSAAPRRRPAAFRQRALPSPERRTALRRLLEADGQPIPGDALALRFGVSRQAIVHDVALLRAEGAPIVATVRGYLLAPAAGRLAHRAVVAVRHRPGETEAELTALVDQGVRVVDVIVEHPVYGEFRGELHLASRSDVEAWADATRRAGAHLLSELTEGVHLHTVEADDPARIERAKSALGSLGYLHDGGGAPA